MSNNLRQVFFCPKNIFTGMRYCDIEKISNIDIEKKNTGNIDIFDIFLLRNYSYETGIFVQRKTLDKCVMILRFELNARKSVPFFLQATVDHKVICLEMCHKVCCVSPLLFTVLPQCLHSASSFPFLKCSQTALRILPSDEYFV